VPKRSLPKRKPVSSTSKLQTIARRAGVSVATVSRVSTGRARVSREISEKVRRAAGELGIELNKRPSRVLGFILSNREMLHPFHSHILLGAEAFASAAEWNMLFLTLRYPSTSAYKDLSLPPIIRRRDVVGGFIVAGTNSRNLLDLLRREELPFAVLGNNVIGDWRPAEYDVVWFDDIQGTFESTRYLQALGHTQIWYIGNVRLPWLARRYEGYSRAMREAGLTPRLSTSDSERSSEIGYIATRSLLARNEPVTAILAGSDPIVEGVYKALRDCGLGVPEDVSVVGFDDVEAALLHPPLTTCRVFTAEVGRKLVELVLRRIEDPVAAPQQVTLPTQLVKRESCQALQRVTSEAQPLLTRERPGTAG
jgi:DNA-binding LacI/PurR family transcriptional regulator